MPVNNISKRKSKQLKHFLFQEETLINYSDLIIHFRQTGQQCWARSAQMLLSYILRSLNLTKKEIYSIFYNNLFLEDVFLQDEDRYKELNQILLGRKLRLSETFNITLDDLFLKMYVEFGATAFSAEVFAAFIKNFLQIFSKTTGRFQSATVTLIIDNDEEEEIFESEDTCTIKYITFKTISKSKLNSGMLAGDDKEKWTSYSDDERLSLLTDFLSISPILSEIPGHAFIISGIDHRDSSLIINDSLSNKVYRTPTKSYLNKLSAFVMLASINL